MEGPFYSSLLNILGCQVYIPGNHLKVKIIPHGQQSFNHTIIGRVKDVRHSFQGKTAIKWDINKPKQLIEIWGWIWG